MRSRRSFLGFAAAGAVGFDQGFHLAALAAAPLQESRPSRDGTWLTYAVNVEMTWGDLPFLDRLRKVAEAGFSHYEFWPWRNKDVEAIISLNRELRLTPVQFTASPKRFSLGITQPGPERREEFEADVRAAVAVAKRLGVKKLCVVAGEEVEGHSRAEQTDAVIGSLKAGARIVEPEGITIILEPLNVLVDHPRQHVVTSEHAARIIKAVA